MNRAAVYAKALAAAIPTAALVLTALVQALTDAQVAVPTWLVAAAAVVTSLAVYAVPNASDPAAAHRVPRSDRLDADEGPDTIAGDDVSLADVYDDPEHHR